MLGPLHVVRDDGPAPGLGGTRLRLLLIRLSLDPGRVVTRERLVDDLWGDTPPAEPAGAVQSLVSRLRRTLGTDRTAIGSHPPDTCSTCPAATSTPGTSNSAPPPAGPPSPQANPPAPPMS
ncbi:winged helix-turn-helix domain-containing protein [Kitasatospora sp. NPDC059673]|uniref:AfsR/SARP family transcriptional regulator n=1 Tax=Kitasatospora sp. NPDC059673 TaxID=3346901 RepID=UPI00368E9682